MLLNYLPKFLQEIEEIKTIMEISEPEVKQIYVEIENILKDLFVLDATENGVIHYEKILSIFPKFTDSLEKRKNDILAIYNRVLPFTYKTLIQKLNSMCGEENYIIDLDYDNFSLYIKLNLEKKDVYQSVRNMLEDIVPVNIFIKFVLDYNTWGKISKFRWKDIEVDTWEEIKEKPM